MGLAKTGFLKKVNGTYIVRIVEENGTCIVLKSTELLPLLDSIREYGLLDWKQDRLIVRKFQFPIKLEETIKALVRFSSYQGFLGRRKKESGTR